MTAFKTKSFLTYPFLKLIKPNISALPLYLQMSSVSPSITNSNWFVYISTLEWDEYFTKIKQ